MTDKMPHIVDTLIEERAEHLISRRRLWPLIKSLVYPIVDYDQAIWAVDSVQGMSGLDVFRWTSEQVQLTVDTEGLANVPESGLTILMPNHPAGMADGIAIFDALREVREDLTLFANRDAVRAAPGLADIIIPVEWVDEKRNHESRRQTVRSMARAVHEQRLIVIFPSGRLARPTLGGLVERPWQPTAMNLAAKYDCPVVPLHIRGHNSWVYYFFYFLHEALRDMTLFRELFNKTGHPYRLTFAEPFRVSEVLEAAGGLDGLTEQLRRFVAEQLPRGATRFTP